MSTAAQLRLTNADLESMPEDGNRYEVIDGELYVSSAPGLIHQIILIKIVGVFLDYLRQQPVGHILPGVGVIFDEYNGVIPDLVFASNERLIEALPDGRFYAAPEIFIEILSPGASNERRDRQVKRSLYTARGAGEYWIVDPENRCVELYRRGEAGDVLRAGDDVSSPFLPGVSAPVAAFFG